MTGHEEAPRNARVEKNQKPDDIRDEDREDEGVEAETEHMFETAEELPEESSD